MTKPMLPPLSAPDEAAFRKAVAEGVADADAGRLTPFEPVAEWLARWGDEDEPPPPA